MMTKNRTETEMRARVGRRVGKGERMGKGNDVDRRTRRLELGLG